MNKNKFAILAVVFLLPALAFATTYDAATVATHNTKASCWVIVQDKVYDLTTVVVWHANVITCGTDMTSVYIGHHMTLTNINPYYIGDLAVAPPTCSYTYSNWGSCQADSTQARTVTGSSPANCVGTPVTSQSCNYVPPPPPTCTYTYSNWGSCTANNQQARTVTGSSPANCVGTPVTSQSCTYVPPPVVNNTPPPPAACTYTYSNWTVCHSNNTQTRAVLSSLPANCAGTPNLAQSCVYVPPPVENNTPPPAINSTVPAPKLLKITVAQLKVHNLSTDCWVSVFGMVYNVTAVMPTYAYFYTCGADNSVKWQNSIFGNDTTIMQPFLIGKMNTETNKSKHEDDDEKGDDSHRRETRNETQTSRSPETEHASIDSANTASLSSTHASKKWNDFFSSATERIKQLERRSHLIR